MRHGDIRWTELNVTPRHAEAAAAVQTRPMRAEARVPPAAPGREPCRLPMRGEHAIAGVFSMEGEAFAGVINHWFEYVEVEDCAAAAALTAAEGGTVRRPPWDVPGVGRLAVIQDPCGAVIGLMQPGEAS